MDGLELVVWNGWSEMGGRVSCSLRLDVGWMTKGSKAKLPVFVGFTLAVAKGRRKGGAKVGGMKP